MTIAGGETDTYLYNCFGYLLAKKKIYKRKRKKTKSKHKNKDKKNQHIHNRKRAK